MGFLEKCFRLQRKETDVFEGHFRDFGFRRLFGGYVFAVSVEASQQVFEGRRLLTATMHFVRGARPGAFTVHVVATHSGRTNATASLSVWQRRDAKLKEAETGEHHELVALCTCTFIVDREPTLMLDYQRAAPPAELPPFDDCFSMLQRRHYNKARNWESEVSVSIERRLFGEGIDVWKDGAQNAALDAEIIGYYRAVDAQPWTAARLAFVCDFLPPPVFSHAGVDIARGVPSIELTLHVYRQPSPPASTLRMRSAHRVVHGDHCSLVTQLFDERGALVAEARQSMKFYLSKL